jgi:zeaxanthin glucosyltransferase
VTHFAVFGPPLRGHLKPLSHLAAELIARGHRVSFVHQEDARALVEAEGAEFHPIGQGAPPVESWTRPMTRIRGIVGLGGMMKRMERFTTTFCSEAPSLLRHLGVDAIISDQLEPAGGLVAEHLGIPWVSTADTLPMNREIGIPPPFVPWPYQAGPEGEKRNRGGWWVSDLLLRRFNRTIARNAEALGIAPKRRMEDCFSPTLQLSQMVPGFDFPRRELPPTFHYTGPFRRPLPQSDFVLPPGDGRPTVFSTLGTLQGSRVAMFRKVAQACQRLNLRLVLTQGGLGKHARAERLPGDPLVYDWVPQEAVLAQVDLVVSHAGINTVLEPLAAGLPMVVMPLAFEQPAIAARVAHSGAGLMLSRRTSAAKLADAVRRVQTEPRFRERAEALAAEMRAAGGVTRAADLIEAMLSGAAPREAATTARAAPDGARGDSRNGSS